MDCESTTHNGSDTLLESLVMDSFAGLIQSYGRRHEILEAKKRQLYEKYKNCSELGPELNYLESLAEHLNKKRS